MSTVVITRQLGEAILRLKTGWWLSKVKTGSRWYQYYWLSPDRTVEGVSEYATTIEKLKKLKLVGDRAFSPYGDRHRRHYRRTTRIYEATELATQFRLPPQEFWVPDEPV